MSDFDDADLSELERRMRAKLQPPSGPLAVRNGMSEDDQRMAEAFLGKDNARRIANAREGRRVRPLPPPQIHFEFYWIPGDYTHGRLWRINRVENGRHRVEYKMGHIDADLVDELAKLQAKGHRILDGSLNPAAPKPKAPKVSKRKQILKQLRFIRP